MELQLSAQRGSNDGIIPGRIVCSVCNKSQARSQYSTSQITKLHRAMIRNVTLDVHTQQLAKCMHCANTQVVELKCHNCGYILEIDQFSRNQRIREDPLCQPCMNYQLSLDSCGNLPTQEDNGDEDITGSALVRGMTETADSGSSYELTDSGSTSAVALYSRNIGAPGSSSGGQLEKGKSGFDKVKAHRGHRAPVKEPKPAPGWTSSGVTGPKSEGPWEGYKFI
ncbi:hypothetical protein N7452_010768 [Penicillium brevicompactum]|uniref:Stc1 domain-containing protein n=1 Tax=Penicillium brevicompactum TaxID=5074 RepID=A0A9W9Q1B3_PENBR|nr:hypothetical protein N7452_010768 [Penicillium brevicompactum]